MQEAIPPPQEWASAVQTFLVKYASMQEALSVARVAQARLPDDYSAYFAQVQNKVCTTLTHSCGRTGPPAYLHTLHTFSSLSW